MKQDTQRVTIQGRNGPIDIEFIEAPISAHGGVSLLTTGLRKTGMLGEIDLNLSLKKRRRGFSEAEYIEALVCLLALGGDRMEDLAQLKADEVMGELIPTPGADAMGQFLQRLYLPHVRVLQRALARGVEATYRAVADEVPHLTLDLDSSLVEMAGHQQGVRKAYEGTRGYHPLLAFFAELEVPVHVRLRSGNASSGQGGVAFLEETLRLYPDLPIRNLRADSAFYDKAFVAACERRRLGFTITADQTARLLGRVAALPEAAWQRMDATFEVAEFRYRPTRWRKPYRFIVTRKRKKKSLFQPSLFAHQDFSYHAFVTSRRGAKVSLVRIHHDRANCENLVKELKDGFAGKNMPSQRFMGNAAWLLCAAMAMVLQAYLKASGLNPSDRPIRAKRFRFRFLHRACRLVRHARRRALQIVLSPLQQPAFQRMLLAPG